MRGSVACWLGMTLGALGGLVPGPARAADTAVDLELVLAVDVSRSMDAREQQVQREGYISALTHPDVLQAIASGYTGRIAITYLEWAGSTTQQVVVPWTLIDGEASAKAFVAQIRPGVTTGRFGTSISSALTAAAAMFDENGFAGTRRVIDVSGDGPNNIGAPVEPARDRVVRAGIVINGLPIMLAQSGLDLYSIADLDAYYRDCVIGGTGAFIEPVHGEEQFEDAIRRKLVQEIAGLQPRLMLAAEPRSAAGSDCFIGEKLRGRMP